MEALLTLQDKQFEAHAHLQQLSLQLRVKERSVKECSLVMEQLEPLSTDVRMFKSIGKAYFLMPKETVISGLAETTETCNKEIETLKAGHVRLENQLKEIEQSIQELIKSSPELTGQTSSADA